MATVHIVYYTVLPGIYVQKQVAMRNHPVYSIVLSELKLQNNVGYSGVQLMRSVNKVMRLIHYSSVLTFKLQIEFVPFKIVPLGGYTPPETLFPLFIATLVVANRNRF